MPLAEEPTLGTWRIKADLGEDGIVEATFTVSESVLPKFEVTFKGPSVILHDSIEETFKVCAHYTHGSNVKGVANVTFFSTHVDDSPYAWRPTVTNVNILKEKNPLEKVITKIIFKAFLMISQIMLFMLNLYFFKWITDFKF
jgi:hypothetical protein